MEHHIHKERCISCSTNIGCLSGASHVISGGENITNVEGLIEIFWNIGARNFEIRYFILFLNSLDYGNLN